MLKKFLLFVLAFLFILPHAAFSAAPVNNNVGYNYSNLDPFHLSPGSYDISQTTLSPEYSTNSLGDIGFFYQVRDITGETYSDSRNVGGPQWFATVYENYSSLYSNLLNNNTNNQQQTISRVPYRRTLGGQVDDVPVYVIGDILDGFNFVFAQEPEPYDAYEPYYNNENLQTYTLPINNGNIGNGNNVALNSPAAYYDAYPDPLETLCVITTDGTARLNVSFANPYARHFPFWWNWNPQTTINASSFYWWQNNYDWTNILANYTVEPVAYIYNPNDSKIYSRTIYRNYSAVYDVTTNDNAYLINDIATGTNLYVISGDIDGDSFLVMSNDIIYYSVSNADNKIYNSSGQLVYTLESAWNWRTGTTDNCVYICEPRTVKESILVQGLDDYEYQINVTPTAETDVNSAEYLNATINIRGDSANYGSKLAYIAFRQRASFTSGYENFREASSLPLVFANVSKGNAADNPLIFDLTIYDDDNDTVVKRMKFKWDAQDNLPNQDLGTFFIMKDVGGANQNPNRNNNNSNLLNNLATTTYRIEARITNRTGTRYMLYRYDRANPGGGTSLYTLPKYWAFDLTEDTYGTLPSRFLLDSHSQIAPGLVTVYDEELDLTKNTTALDSFRLYEYNYTNPKDLWLNYKRVGGIYVSGLPLQIRDGLLAADEYDDVFGYVQPFTIDFVDGKNDEYNTENEIQALTGKIPVLPSHDDNLELALLSQIGSCEYFYIKSSALDSFAMNYDLRTIPSFSEIYPEPIVIEIPETESEDETLGTDTETDSNTSSDKMAVVPVSIRLKIPRKSQLLRDHWEELDAAEDSRALFRAFNKYGTVRVRSAAADELDADLFRAVSNKGANLGVSAQDCVSAFLYDDDLYLDFMIFTADAVSKNTGKTAFVEIFEDDDVPYILIGDGDVDGAITLAFYVDSPLEPASSASSQTETEEAPPLGASGSGGTCAINNFGILIFLLPIHVLRKRKMIRG